jgi:uncharacterized membrane protein
MKALEEVQETLTIEKKLAGILGTERVLAFSDGVFAIVITLLVLEIKVPEIPAASVAAELPHALAEMLPTIVSHIISFVLLGIYWVGHHAMFTLIKRYDRTLLWLNIVFLMCVASMPFPTSLLIRYSDQQISMAIYCSILTLAGLSAVAMWWHASRQYRLIDEHLRPEMIALTYRRVLIAPVTYVIALLVSFVSLTAAKLFLVVAIVVYIVPNPLTRLHIQVGHHK